MKFGRPYVERSMTDARSIPYEYDPIQSQGQGHGVSSEVPKIAVFKVYLLRHLQWELANDHRFLN